MRRKSILIIMLFIILGMLLGCSINKNNEDNSYSQLNESEDLILGGSNETDSTGNLYEGAGRLQVHFIDVGQGDCTLITCKNEAMLIDGGENDMGTYVQNYLQKQGITKLKYVIGTHPDSDHICGLDVVIYKFECTNILLSECTKATRTYEDVISSINAKGYNITYPKLGDVYTLGDAIFTVITDKDNDYGENANNYSIGIRLVYGNNSFLFTGDGEEKAENDILSNYTDIKSDVYKLGHHGSSTSNTEAFLNAVSPEYTVISCGEANEYGHPHAEVMNRLRAMGVKVFRTDEQGTIIATSDGNTVTWSCSPSETWKAGERTVNSETLYYDEQAEDEYSGNYILNKSSKKFHKASCEGVNSMSEKNKEISSLDREKLIEKGYSPCGLCNP